MKKKDFSERVEAIKKAFNVKNDADLACRLGCSQSYISRIKSGKQPLVDRLIRNFLKTFPGLSERFIRHGEGEVLDPARQAEIDREAVIALILRNFARLEPEAQEIILESARRHLAAAEKKNDAPREGGADLENLRRIG